MMKNEYEIARPNTYKAVEYLDEIGLFNEVVGSLLEFMSDDEVGEWVRINGYWKEDDE